jgi:hypothetical protein
MRALSRLLFLLLLLTRTVMKTFLPEARLPVGGFQEEDGGGDEAVDVDADVGEEKFDDIPKRLSHAKYCV